MSDETTHAEIPAVKPVFRYIGDGASLPDVPARDLYPDELDGILQAMVDLSAQTASDERPWVTVADARKALPASGLYEKVGK